MINFVGVWVLMSNIYISFGFCSSFISIVCDMFYVRADRVLFSAKRCWIIVFLLSKSDKLSFKLSFGRHKGLRMRVRDLRHNFYDLWLVCYAEPVIAQVFNIWLTWKFIEFLKTWLCWLCFSRCKFFLIVQFWKISLTCGTCAIHYISQIHVLHGQLNTFHF